MDYGISFSTSQTGQGSDERRCGKKSQKSRYREEEDEVRRDKSRNYKGSRRRSRSTSSSRYSKDKSHKSSRSHRRSSRERGERSSRSKQSSSSYRRRDHGRREKSSSSSDSSSSSSSNSSGESKNAGRRDKNEKPKSNLTSAALLAKIEAKLDVTEQVRRLNDIEEIESEGFAPKSFKTSRAPKLEDIPMPPMELSDINPTSLKNEILCHPNLILNQKEREEAWIKRLYTIRQNLFASEGESISNF